MTEAALRDLKLVGTTTAAGGQFHNVRVTGEAVLTGDTGCHRLRCTGNIEVKGFLQADLMKLTGNGIIERNLQTSQFSAMGELQVSGAVRADRLKVMGMLNVTGNCEAESLLLSGAFNVGGMLHAEGIAVHMHGPCRAQEIGAGAVTVKRSRATALKKMFGHSANAELSADLIEGDTVYVEYTQAAVVRGNRVTLGPGCNVGRVEYRDELQVGKKAVVGERIRL